MEYERMKNKSWSEEKKLLKYEQWTIIGRFNRKILKIGALYWQNISLTRKRDQNYWCWLRDTKFNFPVWEASVLEITIKFSQNGNGVIWIIGLFKTKTSLSWSSWLREAFILKKVKMQKSRFLYIPVDQDLNLQEVF